MIRQSTNGHPRQTGEYTAEPPSAPGAFNADIGSSPITYEFVKYVVSRWWRWALPAGLLVSVVGSLVVWLVMGPVYRAAAWVKIEDRRPRLAFDEQDSPRFVQKNIELIKSPL